MTLMIDDGSPETSTMVQLGLHYIVCVFHVLKAMFAWIDGKKNESRHCIPEEKYNRVKGLLYCMLTSHTKEHYLQYYQELCDEFPNYANNYFMKT